MSNIRLRSGERGVLVGRSGSGKTFAGIWLTYNAVEQLPVIIFDTKGDLSRRENGSRYLTFDAAFPMAAVYTSAAKMLADRTSNVIIYRPDIAELRPDFLDTVLMRIFRRGNPCTVYLDEAGDFHRGQIAGDGLIALITRGRALGMSTIIGTQRPARIALHILSEASWYVVFDLSLENDRKRIAELSGQEARDIDRIPPRHWQFIDADGDIEYFGPVPNIITRRQQARFEPKQPVKTSGWW